MNSGKKQKNGYIFNKTQKLIKLSVRNVLFGYTEKQHKTIVDHTILVGKMCISIYLKTNMATPFNIIFEHQMLSRQSKDN